MTILFAGDTSILVFNSNTTDFQNDNNIVSEHIDEWFDANLLSLGFSKTRCRQCTAKSKPVSDVNVTYDNKQVIPITNKKFVGIFVNDTPAWKKTYRLYYTSIKYSLLCDEISQTIYIT